MADKKTDKTDARAGQGGERTDDLYPAMKRRSGGDAAHVPDTSGDKPSGSGEAAALHDKEQQR